MAKRTAYPAVRQDYIDCRGGLDLLSSPAVTPQGALIAVSNFRCLAVGGYQRIAGYERYDGRPLPSSAVFTAILLDAPLPSAPATVTDPTGGMHEVLGFDGEELYVYGDATAAFPKGATITVSGVSYSVNAAVVNGAAKPATQAAMLAAAADTMRATIGAVPGTRVAGLAPTASSLLAVSDSGVYEATASGWGSVQPELQLDVSNVTATIAPGTTVTGGTSGATGVVSRAVFVYGSGTTTSPGSGTLILASSTGAFVAGEPLISNGASIGVVDAPAARLAPSAVGKVRSVLHTFTGAAGYTTYFVDGATDRVFVYDGVLYSVPLRLQGTPLTHIETHASRLVVAAGASLFISSVDNELSFDAVTGAAEIACGAEITALVAFRGSSSSSALLVGTTKDVRVLYGTDSTSWRLDVAAKGLGVVPDCAVFVGDDVLFASDSGVYSLRGVNAFGNFSVAKVTARVDRLFSHMRPRLLCAVAIPDNSECRFFADNGEVLVVTRVQHNTNTGVSYGYDASVIDYTSATKATFPLTAVTAFTRDGVHSVFMAVGAWVYKADSGTSFDGDPIVAFAVLSYAHNNMLGIRKRYRRTHVYVESEGYSETSFAYDVAPDGVDSLPAYLGTSSVFDSGKLFDVAVWDRFVWSAPSAPFVTIDTPGAGVAISLMVRHESDLSDPFTVKGFLVEFTAGRIGRK